MRISASLIGTFLAMAVLLLGPAVVKSQNFNEVRKMPGSKITEMFDRIGDSVKKQFDQARLTWPPAGIYMRSFKFDKQLELWVMSKPGEPYRLFKTYKICMQSGSMGPKRMEGDYQVPEGFYHINDFNPNSMYHLSLGLNYPNTSDRILGDSLMPGSNIYIHGNCVSTGCIAMGDEPVEELFYIATIMRGQGQEFIPVHVYPVKYSEKKSMEYLNSVVKKNPSLAIFNNNLRIAFDYFETKKQLPVIMVNGKGEYIFN